MKIEITIPVNPYGQARPRKGRYSMYKTKKQISEELLLISYLNKYKPKEPIKGAVAVSANLYLEIAKTWPKYKKVPALKGETNHTSVPDIDNCMKHLLDCCTKAGIWEDDSQVISLEQCHKRYDDGNGPRWEITIKNA